MSAARETAPMRALGFGLSTLVFSWACLSLFQAGSIDLSFTANKVPAVFQLSRAVDGWQFDLVVAMCGLLALASVFVLGLAVSDLLAREQAES